MEPSHVESTLFDAPAGLQKALDLGYGYLHRRERTVGEVRAQLRRRGIAEELAERAIRALVEQGAVDDERFAAMFVSDKRELERWGTERIRRGLASRGVDRELAERALLAADSCAGGPADSPGGGPAGRTGGGEPGGEVQSELDRALELLRRRCATPPVERHERERALGVLLRKGYEVELALDALSAYARE